MLQVDIHAWPSCLLDSLTHKAGLSISPWTDKDKVILAVEELHYVLQFLRAVCEVVVIDQYAIFEWIFHIAIFFVPIFFAKVVIFLLLTKSLLPLQRKKCAKKCIDNIRLP